MILCEGCGEEAVLVGCEGTGASSITYLCSNCGLIEE